MKTIQMDVLVVGGGIAGLWLLAELRARGVRALLASDLLGAGQTIASQGIIHGGTKYALGGKLTGATLAIGDMPGIWRAALRGEGAVDLRGVRILAESQLLWTSAGIGSRLTGFFASKAMRSRMRALPRQDYPELFQHPDFHGSLYRLDEPVLDVPSLLAALRTQLQGYLLQVDGVRSGLQAENGRYVYRAVLPDGEQARIEAGRIILTAGGGNARLMEEMGREGETGWPSMQRRPLQMLLLRGDLPPLYAHALGVSDKPRLTITSHRDAQGRAVWYIGGQPAEQGVGKTPAEAIAHARAELASLLPWLDIGGMQWAAWNVDRAEGRQADGGRPDLPFVGGGANVTLAWPTKLAFAPMLAARLLEDIGTGQGSGTVVQELAGYSAPPLAVPVWESAAFIEI